ncbi:unnamed protein product [Boreogadus saida]
MKDTRWIIVTRFLTVREGNTTLAEEVRERARLRSSRIELELVASHTNANAHALQTTMEASLQTEHPGSRAPCAHDSEGNFTAERRPGCRQRCFLKP